MVLAGLLCLVGQLLGFAHLALVRHATCVAHDEIGHSGPEEARPRAVPGGAALDAPAEAEHEDEHCLAVALRRAETAPLAPTIAALVPGLQTRAAEVTVPPAPTRAGVGLLHLAPKTSPPAPRSS